MKVRNLSLYKSGIAIVFFAMSLVSVTSFAQKCNHASEVQTLFAQLKSNGFNELEPVDYHYFFIDSDPKDIVHLKEVLIKQDYQYVGIAKVRGKYQLEVSKKEAHTAGSAIERGKELKAIAIHNNVEIFDGFELKLEDNSNDTVESDLKEEVNKIPSPQLFKKALDFYNRNETEKALVAFDRCINLGINPETSYYKRGNCKTALGNVNGAIADLESVVRLNPKHYEANFNLGGLYLDKENYDRAIGYYQRAVTTNPQSDNGFYRLAEAYQRKGDKKTALQYCEKSLDVNPGNSYAKELLKKLN
ncbi:tetratricopeptide repeat protein [Emticicia sp. BO119]|uniref:tetratricopeptide repeat protein n=1 Tax=Emticicia sp. BO119 TaxID=2757768 RepID=UPI0015EFF15E|nr:tetratricopeptide repeat protein [Emticicia sp. BO119]MBA4853939.1 tetratricopeptide repeat protein [Emticicia sp. BO119]